MKGQQIGLFFLCKEKKKHRGQSAGAQMINFTVNNESNQNNESNVQINMLADSLLKLD